MNSKKRLALIPARGGSKGVPRKNLQLVGGITLLQRAISVAVTSQLFDEICVSTDNVEIAEMSRKFGARVPFMRPNDLATDSALSIDVIRHAIEHYEKNDLMFESVTLLQPTTPFRKVSDLRLAHEAFLDSACASLISVMDASVFHPSTLYSIRHQVNDTLAVIGCNYNPTQASPGSQRQLFERQLWRNGSIYIFRPEILKRERVLLTEPILSIEMDWLRSINIDDFQDLEIARILADTLNI